MSYDGNDMVAYQFPRQRYRTLEDHIAVNFKTLERDGILLHSEGLQGDILILELKNARLYLHISLGGCSLRAPVFSASDKGPWEMWWTEASLFQFTDSREMTTVEFLFIYTDFFPQGAALSMK